MADTVASLCCQGQNTPLTWVTLFQRTFVVLPDSVLLAMHGQITPLTWVTLFQRTFDVMADSVLV